MAVVSYDELQPTLMIMYCLGKESKWKRSPTCCPAKGSLQRTCHGMEKVWSGHLGGTPYHMPLRSTPVCDFEPYEPFSPHDWDPPPASAAPEWVRERERDREIKWEWGRKKVAVLQKAQGFITNHVWWKRVLDCQAKKSKITDTQTVVSTSFTENAVKKVFYIIQEMH